MHTGIHLKWTTDDRKATGGKTQEALGKPLESGEEGDCGQSPMMMARRDTSLRIYTVGAAPSTFASVITFHCAAICPIN